MRDMPDFTPVQLQSTPDDPNYRKAIKVFRRWAGPRVHLGAAGVFTPGKDGELALYESLVDRLTDLNLSLSEIYGSTISYTAETPTGAVVTDAGVVEALQIQLRVDPAAVVWITGMAPVQSNPSNIAEWRFQLTPRARELAIASFFDRNGVEHDVDTWDLAEAVEAEGERLATLTRA